jgi:hypothetical protein
MNALIAVIALTGNLAASTNLPSKWTPTWQNDYRQAKLQAKEVGKPLAVFVGSGKTGWEMVAREGMDEKAVSLLSSKYVCLYVDVSTEHGQKLAASFSLKDKGLVISDRIGDTQAFYHNGDLAQGELAKTLEKYADPAHVALTTDTLVAAPAPQPVPAPHYYQAAPYYQPAPIRYYGTMSSGSCPNCR